MSIKIQGQTVVDNNKNIVDVNSGTFANYVTSNEGFYVAQTATPSGSSLFKSWQGSNTYVDILDDGSASFAGTIDAAGFTVNGAALSTGGGDVSTLVETATGTTVAEAKTDSDGDRVLDINTVVIAADLGSMMLGKDEVNSPWQHGIYMDATDSQVNDKTRILLYGTGSDDTALQIVDGTSSSTNFAVQHNGRANFGLDPFVDGVQIDPTSTSGSVVDVYTDGSKTCLLYTSDAADE